jgi:novobiocin biosynthesis protein NovU/D-mycarose 3-C-methyltransferase
MNNNLRDNKSRGMTTVLACHICQNKKLRKFLSLGPIPLANSFLQQDELSVPELYYPLDVCFCSNCGLVQLGQVIAPEILFKDYAYLTGTSEPMKAHFARLAESTIQRFSLPRGSLVLDIGSNDGTLLENFQRHNMRVLGIEPAVNVAKLASLRGIETLNDFFGERTAQKVCARKGQASLILATNVFAHVADLEGFLRGVNHLLDSDGVFVIEVPYLLDMLERLEFDTIYHEHLRYFAVRPLIALLAKLDIGVVEIERVSVHGGSLRVYAKKSTHPLSSSVAELLDLEAKAKLSSLGTYQRFAQDVSRIREELLSLLESLKNQGAKIAGYGAPAKGNTLLNYCKIGTDILGYVTDTTPFKQGRYTPGTHIPIFPDSHFHEFPPDYALLLAWNYADEILQKEERYRRAGGKFIIPIPKPQIV